MKPAATAFLLMPLVGGAAEHATAQWSAKSIESSGIGGLQSEAYCISGGSVGGYRRGQSPDVQRPVFWNLMTGEEVDLRPYAEAGGEVYAVTGAVQVGVVHPHAAMWRGTPESHVSLNPGPAARYSYAYGASGGDQVGIVTRWGETYQRPWLWHGSGEDSVDLTPAGAVGGTAFVALNGRQGGFALFPYSGGGYAEHAALWSGSAASFVSIHPPGLVVSQVRAMTEEYQVGNGKALGIGFHALLWRGTPESVVDLHPTWAAGIGWSYANGASGSVQVGQVSSLSGIDAVLWSGTAESAVNLGEMLDPWWYAGGISNATAVEQVGNLITVVGYAENRWGLNEAVVWTYVPPPPPPPAPCFADCTGEGKLDIADFTCFQNRFALADMSKADCTADGKLDVTDFTCFQNRFALGCCP